MRLAATLAADVEDAARQTLDPAEALGLDPVDQLIRRVARQGVATDGHVVSRLAGPRGVRHRRRRLMAPLVALDPAMRVADADEPLGGVIGRIRDEYRAFRRTGDLLAHTFPCA